jgi:hypothetical protein
MLSGKLDSLTQLASSGKPYHQMNEQHYDKLKPTLETSIRYLMRNDYHYTRQEWQTVYSYKRNNRQQETQSEHYEKTRLTSTLQLYTWYKTKQMEAWMTQQQLSQQ